MKKLPVISIALFFAALCLILPSCDDDNAVDSTHHVDNTDFVAQENFRLAVHVGDFTALRLEGVSGSISIKGQADIDSVLVEATKSVGSESYEDAEEHLDLLQIDITEHSDEIWVKTSQPENTYGRDYEIEYDVILPDSFLVLVSSVNGSIEADSINNSVTVSNVNGHVELDDIIGSAYVTLVNGRIEASITLPADGAIAMSNVNGSIELNIPESTSADFHASIVNGDISITNLDLQNEEISNHSVSGTLGNGNGDISLNTVNGNITARGF